MERVTFTNTVYVDTYYVLIPSLLFSFLSDLRFFSTFLQRHHIDHKAIAHVALNHAIKCFVHFLDRGQFDVAGDVVFGAEIEHLLDFSNAANSRSGERAPTKQRE